jgi:hypothetical protein
MRKNKKIEIAVIGFLGDINRFAAGLLLLAIEAWRFGRFTTKFRLCACERSASREYETPMPWYLD